MGYTVKREGRESIAYPPKKNPSSLTDLRTKSQSLDLDKVLKLGGLKGVDTLIEARRRHWHMNNTQRNAYEKSMNSAQKKGGSNGIGVGH